MELSKKSIITGIVIISSVVLFVVIYFAFIQGKPEEMPIQETSVELSAQAPEEETPVERIPEPLQVELAESDGVVRVRAQEISSHPEFANWLESKNLITKFTAAVDNIAQGSIPRAHIDFFKPKGRFRTVMRGGRYYVSPAGYARYNLAANVLDSLDVADTVRLYRQLKPAIQEAFRELGYPEENFQNTLILAIHELLKVPVVEKDIPLESKVISYAIADSRLERLSDAQKSLLRMGPENVRKIQAKLREFGLALGLAEDQLPQPRTYTPRTR
jgi:hypothetical protein